MIEVEHAGGWEPNVYRPYHSTDDTPKAKPKRQYEGLPSLPRVSKPPSIGDGLVAADDKLTKANDNDIRARNLTLKSKNLK
jgi:hypothetical protein